MQTKAKGWVFAGAVLASTGVAAFAQLVEPAVNTTGAPAMAETPTQQTDSSGAPAASQSTAFGAASGAASGEITVGPGPMEAPRKILLSRIKQAKSEGIGIASYMSAFTYIEDAVKAGQTEAQVRPRIESLARALKDQLDKSKLLKTQRPVPPTASQSGGGAPVAATPTSTPISSADIAKKLGGGGDSALIDKIKERFGGQLPDINSLPEGLRDKLINSDKGKELLKKLGK